MAISSIQLSDYLSAAQLQASQDKPAPGDAAQRRALMQATKSVNSSGVLGQNQLVFLVDRSTHRPIIRVEDRETHEVVMQLPPEYVLQLAENLSSESGHIPQANADT